MTKYRPLFLRRLDLRLPGLHVHRLRLNRHLRETKALRAHVHAYTQILLYLGGGGVQEIPGSAIPVQSGTLVLFPPGVRHAFVEAAGRRPLCLVLDFDWKRKLPAKVKHAQLDRADLNQIRQALSALSRNGAGSDRLNPVRIGGLVLGLMDLLLRRLELLEASEPPPPSGIVRLVTRALAAEDAANLTLRELSHRAGYQQDHLNRMLRRATGLTLGQFRSEQRLARAKALLGRAVLIQDAAEQLGFSDQNYFARWFRRQVGLAPREWRSRPERAGAVTEGKGRAPFPATRD